MTSRRAVVAGFAACSIAIAGCGSQPSAHTPATATGQWTGPPQPAPTQRVVTEPSNPPSQATLAGDAPATPDPRCPKYDDVAEGGLDTLRRAVAACVGYHYYFDDRAAVAALLRTIGTTEGKREIIKCAGGFPDIVLLDEKGDTARLTFCEQIAHRQAMLGSQTIQLADGAGLKAWLRDHGVEIESD